MGARELKLRGALERHGAACGGMAELHGGGVEVEAVGTKPVKRVAEDWRVKAERMGAMDAQLVGAASDGMERHAHTTAAFGKHAIVCDGLAPVERIDHLARAVHRVGAHGQADAPLARSEMLRVEQCFVTLPYAAACELRLKEAVAALILGHDEQPGGVHVEAMHHERRGPGTPRLTQDVGHRPPRGQPRNGKHPCRLDHYGNMAVFVDHLDAAFASGGQRVGVYVKLPRHAG